VKYRLLGGIGDNCVTRSVEECCTQTIESCFSANDSIQHLLLKLNNPKKFQPLFDSLVERKTTLMFSCVREECMKAKNYFQTT